MTLQPHSDRYSLLNVDSGTLPPQRDSGSAPPPGRLRHGLATALIPLLAVLAGPAHADGGHGGFGSVAGGAGGTDAAPNGGAGGAVTLSMGLTTALSGGGGGGGVNLTTGAGGNGGASGPAAGADDSVPGEGGGGGGTVGSKTTAVNSATITGGNGGRGIGGGGDFDAGPPLFVTEAGSSGGGGGGFGVVASSLNNMTAGVIEGGQGGLAGSEFLGAGGGGGMGGGGVLLAGSGASINNQGGIQGGAGGNGGGSGSTLEGVISSPVSNTGVMGGGGGEGGMGVAISTGGEVDNLVASTITGGNGGAGGSLGRNLNGATAGAGGNGGDGILVVDGGIVRNSGTISGGTGGAGGSGNSDNIDGAGGIGGAGIRGANVQIDNQTGGSISGGAGPGGMGAAIVFTGGTNSLQIEPGSSISGTVDANLGTNTLILDASSATLDFDASSIGSTQQYQGFSAITKTGAFSLTLTGATTSTAPWTIRGGTLSVSQDASLGDSSGALKLDGGTLQVTGTTFNSTSRPIVLGDNGGGFDIASPGGSFTVVQTLSGAGSLTKLGDGALILTGDDTYTGGTSIVSGTLQVGNGGTTGSIVGDVDNDGGTLAFDRSDAVVFGGAISGSGALRQIGAGTLTLTGDSSAYTGATDVATSTLVVDGKLGGTLAVASAATLAGIGTVGTTTMASGAILAPGNAASPIGTLTVNGNLTLAQGSTYQVETDPAGSTSDKVHATGTANLGGSVVHMGPNGNYAASSTYTILSADQGIHGTFGSVSSDLAFLTPSLTYSTNDVNLLVQLKQVPTDGGTPPSVGSGSAPDTRPIRFADAAVTGNQRAVANGLQSLPASNDLYSRVLNLPNGAPPAVFNVLSGEAHASTTATLQGVTDTVVSLPMDHFRTNLDAGQLAGPATAQLGTGDATSLPQSAAQPVWAQVFGNWRTLGGDGNASKVSESDGGLFVGADHAVGGGWRLGEALGYTGSHSTADNLASKVDVDSYSATIYGGKAFAMGPGKINLTAGTAYTWNDVRTKRQIGVLGLDQTLKANYGASTGQVFTELGYALPLNDRVTVEPFVGAAWSDLRTRGFAESGGSAALNGQGNSSDVTTTTLGLHAQTAFTAQQMQGHLHGTVGWRHAFGDVTPETTMAFDGGQAFTVAGAPIAHNATVLELGADVAVSKNTTVGIAYNGQFGAGNQQNAGSVNVNWRF